jgi:hypothetical protein
MGLLACDAYFEKLMNNMDVPRGLAGSFETLNSSPFGTGRGYQIMFCKVMSSSS